MVVVNVVVTVVHSVERKKERDNITYINNDRECGTFGRGE